MSWFSNLIKLSTLDSNDSKHISRTEQNKHVRIACFFKSQTPKYINSQCTNSYGPNWTSLFLHPGSFPFRLRASTQKKKLLDGPLPSTHSARRSKTSSFRICGCTRQHPSSRLSTRDGSMGPSLLSTQIRWRVRLATTGAVSTNWRRSSRSPPMLLALPPAWRQRLMLSKSTSP